MRVNENESAVDLSQLAAERLKHYLSYDISDLNNLERRISDTDEQAQRARANADMEDFQSYQRELNSLTRNRENLIQEISFSVSRLTILQHVFYESGEPELAEELTAEVSDITQGRLQLPESAEASREEVNRFGLGI
jgi:hypothetical protein